MAGLFQGLFQGRDDRPEFTPDMLPKNRYELFFETLKLNFFNLIMLNLIYALFTIPMWFWIWLNSQVLNGMLAAVTDMQSIRDVLWTFFSQGQFSVFLMGMVPCIIILGPAKTALKFVTRNWARDEHAYVWADFKDAMKANWKQGLAMSCIDAVVFFLGTFGIAFYGVMATENTLYYAFQIFVIVTMVVFMFINLYVWPMMVTYEMKLRDLLRNCLVLAIGRLPLSLLYIILTVAPMVLVALFPVFALYYLLIGYAFHAFLNVSYTNGVFDKYINAHIEGAEVGKGLRKTEEDEYEYEDIDEEEDEEEK